MPRTEPFDEQTSRYDEWFERHRHAYESELQAVRSLLPRTGKGIEIGVGTGRFAAPLGIRHGLEPSPAMAQIAESRGVTVIPGVAEELPLADAGFEFVLMITTVCFLDDVERAFREAFRVLRPGGAIVTGFVDRDSPMGRAYEDGRHLSPFYRVATFYSAAEVAHLLISAGFRDLAYAQTLFRDLDDVTTVEPVLDGHGRGGFVVIRGNKPAPTASPGAEVPGAGS